MPDNYYSKEAINKRISEKLKVKPKSGLQGLRNIAQRQPRIGRVS